MPKPNWQEAKARRQSEQMIAESIAARVKFHMPPLGHPLYNLEFNLCRGYTCGEIIWNTRYAWCDNCRAKFYEKPTNQTTS